MSHILTLIRVCAWCKAEMGRREVELNGEGPAETATTHGMCDACHAKAYGENCTCGPVAGAGSVIDVQTCDWCRNNALDFKTDAMHERKEPVKP